MSGFDQGLVLIVRTVFGIAGLIVVLRFVLQWVRADFHNPLSQFVVNATQPALKPLRRFVPGIAGLDVSALVLLFAITMVEVVLLTGIVGVGAGIGNLLLWVVGDMLRLIVNVFFFAILIGVVLSWIDQSGRNPVRPIVDSISYPLLSRARSLIPPIGGMDLSPIPVLLGLQLVQLWLVQPILNASRLPF